MRQLAILVAVSVVWLNSQPTAPAAGEEIGDARPRSGAADWPQFRGPNSSGVSDGARPPLEFAPETNVVWRTPLPPGISSPCIWGDRIFLTGFRAPTELVTICLDRATGSVLWERRAPNERIESHHSISSPAASTPATDGRRVYVFFGSYGLLCYDFAGNPVWQRPLGPFRTNFGMGSSPIVVGDRLLMNCDDDLNSVLLCLDARTGDELWRADRSEFHRGCSTPVLWEVEGQTQVVVAGTLRVVGYDLETGDELWTVRGIARMVNTTPVVGDRRLYVSAWAYGSDNADRATLPPAGAYFAAHDTDGDGHLAPEEIADDAFRTWFHHIDNDQDGRASAAEWDRLRHILDDAQNVLLAIRPGGSGDITETHVAWSFDRYLPYVPSPLYYEGIVYLVKNGGIVTALDAESGELLARGRLDNSDDYYASPVAAGGLIYMTSQRGEVSVLRTGGDLVILATHSLGEPCMATPAIADGRLYLRTEGYLYCFAE